MPDGGGEEDGGRVRRGDHLPSHRYIKMPDGVGEEDGGRVRRGDHLPSHRYIKMPDGDRFYSVMPANTPPSPLLWNFL